MMNFENTIVIQCPVEEVFTFVADFENVPKWNYYVKSVRRLSNEFTGKGTVYHQVRKSDEQMFKITEYSTNAAITVKTSPESQPQFERRFVFEEVNNGTKIVDNWKLTLGRNPLIERFGRSQVKTAVRENLDKLKELLETGQTRLQDGRMVKV